MGVHVILDGVNFGDFDVLIATCQIKTHLFVSLHAYSMGNSPS